MAIIETVKTRGSASTATLSGNIVIDEGAGELRVYKTVEGIPTLASKMDANGTYYYGDTGEVISSITTEGSKYYDNDGNLLCIVNNSGFNFYDVNGVLRATISQSASGNMRILTYDANGKGITLMGQAPNGTPTIASVVSGYDVEQELGGGALSFSLGSGNNDDNNLDIPPVPFNGEG